nr:LOW QUALITY PROTEIN: mitoregulin [Vicugna pacos]
MAGRVTQLVAAPCEYKHLVARCADNDNLQAEGSLKMCFDWFPGRSAHARPAPPGNARRLSTPPPRRSPRCAPAAAMADVSERTLQLSVLVAFASGVLLGWQANRLRRRYLDWRKKRLQDKLAATQKKLDLA